MGQLTALARALGKAPAPQVDPSDGVQRVKSAYQTFGPFTFHPARHLLLFISAAARWKILAELVERPGELVSKDELTARVWPNTVVEESNLKVNVCALRRASGEGQPGRRYIATVSGRGYRFVAPI